MEYQYGTIWGNVPITEEQAKLLAGVADGTISDDASHVEAERLKRNIYVTAMGGEDGFEYAVAAHDRA